MSFAGYKDIDPAIAEQEIYSHIVKEEARFTFRLQKEWRKKFSDIAE